MLADGYREVGISQEAGIFSTGKSNFNTSMVTQNFGRNGSDVFVTGVAYADKNADNFYSVGEGRAGVTYATAANTTTTAAAGGYALKIAPGAAVDVTGTVGALAFSVRLDVSFGNAKLDVVNGDTFFTATDITLQTGINKARLLGTADLDATGNAAANDLQGNKAANILSGLDGLDNLFGGAGNDTLLGGAGNDKLSGGDGADSLLGGSGLDVLIGGAGADRLNGEAGADVLTGGLGADAFVFTADGGKDRVTDFARDDRLLIDNAIWGNTALTAKQVVAQFGEMVGRTAVLDFDNGQSITLTGVTKLAGLDAYITII
jgi:Ca2+-binding RTX toxin-like protein